MSKNLLNCFLAGFFVGFAITVLFLALSCSTTPKTHEKWAQYCLSQPDEKFRKCLEDWDKWQKGPMAKR